MSEMALEIENKAQNNNTKEENSEQKSRGERVADRAFTGAANLTKLLPTATVLAFEVLSPAFTNGGKCYPANKYLTGVLLGLSALFCFLDSFTDSYTAENGTVYYGIATRKGLWTLNPRINSTVDLSSYRLTALDFVHAVLSVLVFASVAFMDNNVVACYYPGLNENGKQIVTNIPLGVGFVCSLVFVAFPTTRHGIGYQRSS